MVIITLIHKASLKVLRLVQRMESMTEDRGFGRGYRGGGGLRGTGGKHIPTNENPKRKTSSYCSNTVNCKSPYRSTWWWDLLSVHNETVASRMISNFARLKPKVSRWWKTSVWSHRSKHWICTTVAFPLFVPWLDSCDEWTQAPAARKNNNPPPQSWSDPGSCCRSLELFSIPEHPPTRPTRPPAVDLIIPYVLNQYS